MPRSPAEQFADLANVYASMGVMLWCAAWQWPLLVKYPVRRRFYVIQGGRA